MLLGNCAVQQLFKQLIIIFVIDHNILPCLSTVKLDNFLQYNIEENQPVGKIIGKISEDIKRHSNPIWFLTSDNNLRFFLSRESLLFELESKSGILKTKQVIDLERLCPRYCIRDKGVVNLTVNIWSPTNLQGIAKISVIIEDINDNLPLFEQSTIEISIKEMLYTRGKTIKIPRAIDRDISLKNNEISYKLKDSSEYFDLQIQNKFQPVLVVLKTMDSENINQFQLVLFAWNSYFPRFNVSQLNIIINVIDINDNEPFFSKPLYLIPVPENTPVGSIVHKISALDLDVNSQLRYYSADPTSSITSIFKIEIQGSIRLLRSLDYESQPFYYMSAKVTDGEFIAFTKLKFVIIDVNDETPQFNLNPTNISIFENSELKEIAQVTVYDRDSEDINGKLKCYEPNYDTNKQIVSFIPNVNNPYQFTIKLIKPLDRDILNGDYQYAAMICEDNGIPIKLTSTFTLTINVLDRNDNRPMFTQPSVQISVKENSPTEIPIYTFKACDIDRDLNARITYRVMANTTTEDCCRIDESSGTLFSYKKFDREKRNFYKLIIVATDQSQFDPRQSTSILVNITVLDENDEKPQLLRPYNFTILENQPQMTYIGLLKAQDKDEGENNGIIFSLVTDLNSVFFMLLKNGSLYSRRRFDREEKEVYSLEINLEDSGIQQTNSVKSRIYVKVLDENDNTPIINLPEFEKVLFQTQQKHSDVDQNSYFYRLNVSIHSSVQYPIGQIKVTDKDIGENGRVTLKLIPESKDPNLANLVSLDEEKNELYTTTSLNKDLKDCYHYTIFAIDHGIPNRRSEKKVMFCFLNQPVETPLVPDKERMSSLSKANILIVIILAGTSAFLTALLVSAILCMIQPCKELNRRRYAHSQNVLDPSNQNPNESMMDNLLKSREEFDETFLNKISESSVDLNFNVQNKLQDNWPLKLMACSDLNCQSVIMPKSTFVMSTEEQRSDSGRGASDEDNNIITSSININKLNQINQSMLINSLHQSQLSGTHNIKTGHNEMNLFASCGCELCPTIGGRLNSHQTTFPQTTHSNSLKYFSKLPTHSSTSLKSVTSPLSSDLVMENSIYRSSNVQNMKPIPAEGHSPILSISDLSSHIDNLFFSQCCKKY